MSAPTAAALRAAVALFGTAHPVFDEEWLAKRAAVIDEATGLPELLVIVRKLFNRWSNTGPVATVPLSHPRIIDDQDAAEMRAALVKAESR